MSKRPTRSRFRTAAAIKADAPLLSGDRSRVAKAATGDADPAPENGTVVGELWLYGIVGGYWFGFDAESVADALRKLDVDVLYVRIHSPGGRASDGVAIGNLFRNHRATVVVVVDGLAASAASVIAIAGDEIVMCPGSQMMLHDAMMPTYGNQAQLKRDSDWIGSQSDNYANVYALKGGGTAAQWREVMLANDGEGTWYTADEAVAAGLADEVGNRVASGSPPTAPADQIDEGDDELLARVEHDLFLLEREIHPAARAAWSGVTPKPPAARPRTGSTTQEGSTDVSLSDAAVTTMRNKLGIAEDADEATILAALDEALDERADESSETTIPEGHVVLPAAELATLRSNATAGAAAAVKLHERDRESFLDKNKAKFPAELRSAWATQYDLDPAKAVEAMSKAPNIIPVDQLGHEHDGVDRDDATAGPVKDDPNFKNWRF